MSPSLSRRAAFGVLGCAATLPLASLAFAEGVPNRKFVLVILRGAMDGLSALIPNDPALDAMRAGLMPNKTGRLPVNGSFALHPAFSNLHKLATTREAVFIHACATTYRGRSHFDGQDQLETLAAPGARDGWLNRALSALPGAQALSVGPAVPMVLRGEAPVSNWSPSAFAPASDDLINRLRRLYAIDPAFAETLSDAESMAMGVDGANMARGAIPYKEHLSAAGRLMSAENGPGVTVVSLEGWDTHANQARQLDVRFRALDDGIAALQSELGDHWSNTVVVVASEFGRTVAMNGAAGSDHGTGGLVMLLGGAVNGTANPMRGEWPGVSRNNLFEGRDLMPANNLSAVLKGALIDHLHVPRKAADLDVFPGSGPAMTGLIRA